LNRDRANARAHWHRAVERLALFFFGATGAALAAGAPLLHTIYTAKYADAVPLFFLATLEAPLWALPVDAVLRAAGETRYLLVANLLRFAGLAAAVTVGIEMAGLKGAILAGIVCEGG